MKIEDLLKMTMDEAVTAQKNGDRPVISQWIAAQRLEELRSLYLETKDGSIILEALYHCCLESLPLPEWCEVGYLAAYRKIRQYSAGSWDEVFGRPHPKGTHLNAKNEKWGNRHKAYLRICEILHHEPGTPIDQNLFERVGRELGVGGKTKVEEWYYEVKKEMEKSIPGNS
ncbi:MAG: hypothetical protein ACLFV2_10555 [Desulfurivibrionaceae bacterium]